MGLGSLRGEPSVKVARSVRAVQGLPKGDAQGKKKEQVQQFTMCYSLTKMGFISEPVDP